MKRATAKKILAETAFFRVRRGVDGPLEEWRICFHEHRLVEKAKRRLSKRGTKPLNLFHPGTYTAYLTGFEPCGCERALAEECVTIKVLRDEGSE